MTIGKALAFSTLRFIPVIGPVIAATSLPAVSAAVTYAIGKVFISHFETGGTLLDFDPVAVREYFRAEFAKGLKEAAKPATPAITPAVPVATTTTTTVTADKKPATA